MTPLSVVIVHGGLALELGLLEYLFRVLQYLLAVGSIAVLASVGLDAYDLLRSRFT